MGYIGIIGYMLGLYEKKMETTMVQSLELGLKAWGLGLRFRHLRLGV